MPRANRLPPIRSACYYYRRRSVRGRQIVSDREELEILLETLAVVLRTSGARLYAFHVDSTQLHFVARAGNSPLLPALGIFCHELTRRLNGRRRERGPLFTERAHATLFQPETWLLPIARYVHSIRPAFDSLAFTNSDGAYRARGRVTGLTTTVILRALGSTMGTSSILDSDYARYFDAPVPPAEAQLIEHGSHEDSRILGDREFITGVLRACGSEHNLDVSEMDSPDEVIRHAAELMIDRLHAVCRRFLSEREAHDWIAHTSLQALRSKSRRMPLPLVRAMIADYVVAHGVARCSEVERYFGMHSKSLAAGLRRRYRARIVARLSGVSAVAPHRVPDIDRSAHRVNAELLEDVIAVVLDG